MRAFDTGHKDRSGKSFLIGSRVSWIDKEGFPCEGEIILKDGCKIGVDSWEGFIFVCDFDSKFKIID